MISVIQRVAGASVLIENKIHNEISKGLLVLLGVKKGDTENNSTTLAKKLLELRIFNDENDKMNLSVKDISGDVLVISQFTLCADNGKSGNRPSFVFAEEPAKANFLYMHFVEELKSNYHASKIKTGVFAAKMEINLVNEGPVTIILEK